MRVVAAWWQSDKYPRCYVDALRSQVPGITVLTNGAGLYEPERYRGWWAKLEVFRPENRHLRPCLCLDLDTFVFDLAPILALDSSRLWLIREFLGKQREGQSGLFVAPCRGVSDDIWRAAEKLTDRDFSDPHGDGGFLRRFPFSFIPDEVDGIYSYKAHCRDGLPPDARVCCFHGVPKPHEVDGWAGEYWNKHA